MNTYYYYDIILNKNTSRNEEKVFYSMEHKDFLTICWAFFWQFMVFSIVFASISGLISAFIVVKLGYPELAGSIKNILLWISVILANFVALRSVLITKFKSYSITLIKVNN